MLLDDSEIGTRDFRLVDSEGDRRGEIEAEFVVTFVAVDVYPYMRSKPTTGSSI